MYNKIDKIKNYSLHEFAFSLLADYTRRKLSRYTDNRTSLLWGWRLLPINCLAWPHASYISAWKRETYKFLKAQVVYVLHMLDFFFPFLQLLYYVPVLLFSCVLILQLFLLLCMLFFCFIFIIIPFFFMCKVGLHVGMGPLHSKNAGLLLANLPSASIPSICFVFAWILISDMS